LTLSTERVLCVPSVIAGADLSIADINGVTALHMALCDHTTVDLSAFPKLRKSMPKELDQAPAIAKVRRIVPTSGHFISCSL